MIAALRDSLLIRVVAEEHPDLEFQRVERSALTRSASG